MKLRFHTDSLRLRLNQSEVAQFEKTGRVENAITFSPNHALIYCIETADVPGLAAEFAGSELVRRVTPRGTR